MFEDSLVESTGRIRTRSSSLAVGSFFLQAAVLAGLILIPYLYPATLPRQALSVLLTAPPPPPAPASLPHRAERPQAVIASTLSSLHMPSRIPPHAVMDAADRSTPSDIGPGLESTGAPAPEDLRNIFSTGAGPASKIVVEARARSGPLRISAGVAAGRLLTPIRPVYPVIASTARIQGTVVIEATISKTGTIENARAVSGPAMLVAAAITAIKQARYQPYKLNGEPVEIDTTINVVFRLGQE